GARRLRDLLQGHQQRAEIAVPVAPLVQAEQVRDRLRPVEAGEHPGLQRGRRLVERSGGDSERGEEEKAVHAFGLPRGEQSKPTHREATADRLAPFLGSAASCCTASSGWTPAPRAGGAFTATGLVRACGPLLALRQR